MAKGMAGAGRRRHTWMVARNRLGRRYDHSMACGLIELETLDCYRSRAKDHAPQGKIDFKCVPHLIRPRVISI